MNIVTTTRAFLTATVTLAALCTAPAATPERVDGKAAFAKIKSLAGTWHGHLGKPDGPPTKVVYRITGGGSAVMETLFPGDKMEMVSIYHLAGDDLVFTHYCAAGNQPQFELDRRKSTPTNFVFKFEGGTNVNPRRNTHIHMAEFRFFGANKLESRWTAWEGGKESSTEHFFLTRKSRE